MAHEMVARPLFEEDVAHLTDRVAASIGVVVNSKTWPVLDVTIEHSIPLRLRFTCDNWSEQPPSIKLLNADGAPFSGKLPGGIFNAGNGKFICMRGSREYHQHSNHLNDRWESYRDQDGMTIVGILQQLRQAWVRLAK